MQKGLYLLCANMLTQIVLKILPIKVTLFYKYVKYSRSEKTCCGKYCCSVLLHNVP